MAKRKKFEQGQAQPPAALADDSSLAIPAVEGSSPDPDKIARRAYELYLARGGEHGRADDDWYTAERELTGGMTSGRKS